jgi:hypothetical protein
VAGDTVYEWLPISIVAGTFLLGVLAAAIESGRLPHWMGQARA